MSEGEAEGPQHVTRTLNTTWALRRRACTCGCGRLLTELMFDVSENTTAALVLEPEQAKSLAEALLEAEAPAVPSA